jgi:hypothetical protein
MQIRFHKFFKIFISIALFFGLAYPGMCQDQKQSKKDEPKKSKKWDKFVFGGSIGLQFGTVTYIDISPVVGYYVTPKLLTGLGLTYQYYDDTYYSSYKTHIFGGRAFSNYALLEHIGNHLRIKTDITIFFQGEYEILNIGRDFSKAGNAGSSNRYWLNGILLGGGIREPIGKKSSFNFALLYNILADSRTPYENPIIRFGFYF